MYGSKSNKNPRIKEHQDGGHINGIDKQNKGIKEQLISLAHTPGHNRTMMIKIPHTTIASKAMPTILLNKQSTMLAIFSVFRSFFIFGWDVFMLLDLVIEDITRIDYHHEGEEDWEDY
jgi:hypothetical protein